MYCYNIYFNKYYTSTIKYFISLFKKLVAIFKKITISSKLPYISVLCEWVWYFPTESNVLAHQLYYHVWKFRIWHKQCGCGRPIWRTSSLIPDPTQFPFARIMMPLFSNVRERERREWGKLVYLLVEP